MNKIGIDLGGTKIEGILLDESLNVVKKIRIPTATRKRLQINYPINYFSC